MGYEVRKNFRGVLCRVIDNTGHEEQDLIVFNPLTNKSDLMDVECALDNICVTMNFSLVIVEVDTADGSGNCFEAVAKYADHPDKFTARSAAVCAVAEQIYDKGQV